MWYLAIFMTPHLKQQERNNGVWGLAGAGGHKHFCHISGWGSRIFSKGIGGGRQMFCPPYENVTGPPPSNK